MLYCGICGADLASYTGNQPFTTYPRVPGHEFSARIVDISENDKGLKPGDVVICNLYFNCGKCYSCRRGFVNCCTDNQTMGVQRDGAFQEYITMGGQFSICLPEKDMLIVTTADTQGLLGGEQTMLDALWNCLLPGVCETPLAPTASACAALNRRLTAMVLPCVANLAEAGGRNCTAEAQMQPNAPGLTQVRLRLDALELCYGEKSCTLRFQVGGLAQGYLWDDPTIPYTAAAGWRAPDTLLLRVAGVGFGLASAVCYAVQNILLATKLKKYSAMTNLVYAFLFSAAASFVFCACTGELPGAVQIVLTPKALVANVLLGIVCSLVAQWLYNTALKTIPASKASIAATFEPVAAALFGFVLFNQTMDGFGIAGIVCELAALVLLQMPARANQKEG